MAESESVELNCNQCLEMLDAFYDMELTAAEAQQVEEHLACCAACREELNQIEHMVERLKSLPPIEMQRDLSDVIESKILAARTGQVKESGELPVPAAVTPISIAAAKAKSAGRADGRKVVALRWFYLAASAAAVLAIFVVVQQRTISGSGPVVGANSSSSSSSSSGAPLMANGDNVGANVTGTAGLSQPSPGSGQPTVAVKPQVDSDTHEVSNRSVAVERKILANAGNKAMAKADLDGDHVSDGDEVVALFGEQSAGGSETGLSTNEDGLYAIKL